MKSHRIKSCITIATTSSISLSEKLRDKLGRSKIRQNHEEEKGNFPCGHSNCEICKILEPGKGFKCTVTGEVFKMNFQTDCNSICVVYLLTCRICEKQYNDSAITKFRERFNQYKSIFEVAR